MSNSDDQGSGKSDTAKISPGMGVGTGAGTGKDEPRRLAAVALRKYGIDESALPKVVAAGYGKLAEQIVEMAFKNGIKVREDKDLAQMLAAIEIDSDIPSEALVAIAEILAYVYKANGTYQSILDEKNKNGDQDA